MLADRELWAIDQFMECRAAPFFCPSCEISIVIPAYNEESRLGATLDRILNSVRRRQWPAEIIVIDGCSQDGTAALVRHYSHQHSNVRLLQIPSNRGKGYCMRGGSDECPRPHHPFHGRGSVFAHLRVAAASCSP